MKNTKKALFMSALSLLLCMSMLVGTTFAWFTDVAESGLNKIVAGTLDVALEDANGNSVEGATELFTMPELWEPGAVAYTQLKVVNKGTLDLKASMSINYEDVNSLNGHALSEVLKYAIIDASNVDLTDRAAVLAAAKASTNKGALNVYNFTFELLAGEKSELQTLVVFWEPNADGIDNLYNANNGQETSDGNPLQINVGVMVYATQLGGKEEEDSFGPDFDENAPTTIKVGNDSTVYESIAEAYAATGKTDFKVSGPIDMSNLGGLFATANQNVTFTQIEDSSVAYYDFSNAITVNANGANITINGGYIQGLRSNTGNGFGFQHTSGTITYNGVTINDSWTNEHNATVVYKNCTFTGTYYVWTYSVPSITFTNCVFDKEDSRAILVYSHGNNPIVATVENCQFKADAKGYAYGQKWVAAVEVDASYISSGATVNITNCTADANYNGIVRDKGGKNATITVNGGVAVFTADQLQAELNAAEDGAVIVLGCDITGDVTATQKADVDVVIDGIGNKFEGSITINGDARAQGAETLTIKNINFVSSEKVDFISAPSKIEGRYNYSHNITVDNCTFTATTYNEDIVGVKVNSSYNLTVVNCKATNMHSLMQAESCKTTVIVDKCVVENCKSGVSFNNTQNAVIKNSTISAVGTDGYGVRVKAENDGYGLTVENCAISAWTPVLVRNATKTYSVAMNGTNTLTAANAFGYEVVVCAGDWDDDAVAPAAPTGNITLVGVDGFDVFKG